MTSHEGGITLNSLSESFCPRGKRFICMSFYMHLSHTGKRHIRQHDDL
jgi:hypothetical protein